MTTAEYMISKKRGLFLLTETVITRDGSRLPAFTAYFESKEAAMRQAKSMMGNKGDTLEDETGILERVA